jgi:hypothetical protein
VFWVSAGAEGNVAMYHCDTDRDERTIAAPFYPEEIEWDGGGASC